MVLSSEILCLWGKGLRPHDGGGRFRVSPRGRVRGCGRLRLLPRRGPSSQSRSCVPYLRCSKNVGHVVQLESSSESAPGAGLGLLGCGLGFTSTRARLPGRGLSSRGGCCRCRAGAQLFVARVSVQVTGTTSITMVTSTISGMTTANRRVKPECRLTKRESIVAGLRHRSQQCLVRSSGALPAI